MLSEQCTLTSKNTSYSASEIVLLLRIALRSIAISSSSSQWHYHRADSRIIGAIVHYEQLYEQTATGSYPVSNKKARADISGRLEHSLFFVDSGD